MPLTIDEVAKLLWDFTHKNAATKESYPFFLLLHRLGLKGMGIGQGAEVASSGEEAAMRYALETLEGCCPGVVPVVFDIGANAGMFLEEATRVFPKSSRIYSFEPSAAAFAKLEAVAARFPDWNVELCNVAVGKGEGRATLYSNRPGSALASLYRRRVEHFKGSFDLAEEVPVTTVDAFCATRGIERIHYLKIDTEGGELDCLAGARTMLEEGRIDFVQFEFGGGHIDARTFFQDFWYTLKDYDIMRLLRDGVLPIKEYTEFEEIFLTQNYLARRKGL